jgi:hypothetical protein
MVSLRQIFVLVAVEYCKKEDNIVRIRLQPSKFSERYLVLQKSIVK